jgi:hypothetical protein
MQLTETPEGKSSLQNRLNEAERRAHEAEVTAQDAQATLARTLLEAARVEAVVTARIKAQSEAEIEALRSELDVAKRLAAPGGDLPAAQPEAVEAGLPAAKPPAVETAPVPEPSCYRPIVLTEWDRPMAAADDMDDVVERPNRVSAVRPAAARLTPLHLILPAITAVSILLGYDVAGYLTAQRDAVKAVTTPASSTTAEASGANWLLYMPVERTAVSEYLGGNAKLKRQLAVTSPPAPQRRN